MNVVISIIKKLLSVHNNPRYKNALLSLALLIFVGTIGSYYFEHYTNEQFSTLADGLWWSFVTISTVGYGDKYPITTGGKLVGLIMMFGGIGIFGYLAGSIIEDIIKRQRGKANLNLTDHYVICNYNRKARGIVEEIYGEEKNAQLVLISSYEENPLADLRVNFINGDSTDEKVLKRANISRAKSVIVLASERFDEHVADSHSVLTTLAVRHLNPSIKITAEALDINNESHLKRAGANEVIVSDRIVSRLIARSNFYDKGFNFIRDLVTTRSGINIYDSEVEEEFVGKTYSELYSRIKASRGALLGLSRQNKIIALPDEDMEILKGDHLIYIAYQKII